MKHLNQPNDSTFPNLRNSDHSPECLPNSSEWEQKTDAIVTNEKSKLYLEFEVYWRLGEEMIAAARKIIGSGFRALAS